MPKKRDRRAEIMQKYPKLFRQKDLPKSQTCMCWGLDVDDGWLDIIDDACGMIQSRIEHNPHIYGNVEFVQVKEKFGGLRMYYYTIPLTEKEFFENKKASEGYFYRLPWHIKFVPVLRGKYAYNKYLNNVRENSSYVEGIISYAEHLSYNTCEVCGKPGKPNNEGWIKTLCDNHRKEK